jgi:hypothetical protein
MKVPAPARAWSALLALLVFGCDKVGEPLVGNAPPPPIFPKTTCGTPPECEPPELVERAHFTVHPVDLRLCGGPGPDDPELCEPPPEPRLDAGAGSDDEFADVDGGVPDDVGSGDIDGLDPDAPVLPPCPKPAVDEPVPAQLRCNDLTSRKAPEPGAGGERLAQAEWHDANVRIESSVPRTVVIERLTVANAWVELRGPVTLRIDASSRVPDTAFDSIEGLRVAGVATAAGAPRLELEGVKLKMVAIGDANHAFQGAVSTRSSELFELELNARAVQFESTRVEKGRLRAEQLITADSVLSELEIESERAVLSATMVRKTHLKRCGELMLIATRVRESVVAACSGSPARFYQSQFGDSVIDGVIESETTRYSDTIFGTLGPTELRMFNGGFDRVSLCTGVERLVVSSNVRIGCSMCEEPETFFEDKVCRIANGEIKGNNNVCPGFAKTDEPPKACELPWPEFHRVDERF